jgi:hypothetical protein
MLPAYTLRLNHQVLRGLVALGRFDGRRASLACASTVDNIVVHTPGQEQVDAGRRAVGYRSRFAR